MSKSLAEKVEAKVKDTEFESFFNETFVKGRNAREVAHEMSLPADYETRFLRFLRSNTATN